MKKKLSKPKEVFKVKNKIFKKFPFVQELNVDIEQVHRGKFKASIMAHIPSYKLIIVSKIHNNFNGALEKSFEAVSKQAKKFKTKKHHTQSLLKAS